MLRNLLFIIVFAFIGCQQKKPSLFEDYKIEFNRPKEKAKIKYNPKEYDSYEDFKDNLQFFYIENDEGISFYEKDNPDDKYFAGYVAVVLVV